MSSVTQGTTAYRYNTFILNFMANPMIYRGHYKFPYISLYLEFPSKPWPPVPNIKIAHLMETAHTRLI